jgi:hypothetical protein
MWKEAIIKECQEPPTSFKLVKLLGRFWIQGSREFKKNFTPKREVDFTKKQYQIYMLNIPHDLKHIKFQSFKIILSVSQEAIPNPYYDLVFGAHMMIRVNGKGDFKYNNEEWIYLKIQK